MNLKQIIFEQTSLKYYKQLEEYWGDDRRKKENENYARIIQTIKDDDPERLLRTFFSLPITGTINVRHPDNLWLKFPICEGEPENLAAVCDLIMNDKGNKNFLELVFLYRGHGFIEFAKEGKDIYAYKFSINKRQRKLFSPLEKKLREEFYTQGLLLPPVKSISTTSSTRERYINALAIDILKRDETNNRHKT